MNSTNSQFKPTKQLTAASVPIKQYHQAVAGISFDDRPMMLNGAASPVEISVGMVTGSSN